MKNAKGFRTWTLVTILTGLFLALFSPGFAGDGDGEKGDKKDLEERIEKLERKVAQDRLKITGDLRVTLDNIDATMAGRFNGLALQKGIVDTLFFLGATGAFPSRPDDVGQYIAANYGDYLFFQNNLTFDNLKQSFGSFPAEAQGALFNMLLPNTWVPEQDYQNETLYTTRLRLNLRADVMENLSFNGRLTMYKTWGDSTGVQVFNGAPNSFTLDGTNAGTPNSDIVRVDRAYFSWKKLAGSKWYLSIGRRPSTYGPPYHIRDNELRQGTPNGHVVNYQFDGITLGYNLNHWLPGNTFRLCYGVGFESGFGSGDQLKAPADRLSDTQLGGINWDIYNTDEMNIQMTAFGAWNVTDGFNGLVVLPADPLSGNSINAPVVLRYTPSANLGDMYLMDILLERHEMNFSWFLSYAYTQSQPNPVTTPFGGMFSDPFETPEDQSGSSIYAGIRMPLGNSSHVGLEYNHGSEYWFNFSQGADDIIGSKLATRGDVFEAYWIHGFNKGLGRARANLRLSAMYYDYEYSGSGWHVGAPKKLDEMPILAFPTYQDALDLRTSLVIKF